MLPTLKMTKRELSTRSHVNQLRNTGFTPAVFYGKNAANLPITVEEAELLRLVRQSGRNALVHLDLGNGEQFDAMIQTIQMDKMGGKVLHVDFKKIHNDVEIQTVVSITLIGTPKGVQAGGVLEQQLDQVQISCLPKDLPDALEVDISNLEINDLYRVEDLTLPAHVEVRTHPEEVIVRVVQPRVQTVDTEEEEAETPTA